MKKIAFVITTLALRAEICTLELLHAQNTVGPTKE